MEPKKIVSPPELRTGMLVAQAVDRLREAIVRGELRAGQALREQELSNTFGISRIPLREALRQLVGEGLVENRPNRGSTVACMRPREVSEITEVCALVETQLMRQAVPGLGEELLDQAAALIEEMDRTDDVVDWFRTNWRFHSLLYQPADRPLSVEIVRKLRARADRYIYVLARDPERRRALNEEHRGILAACRARDVEEGATRLGNHLVGGKDQVLQLMTDQEKAAEQLTAKR